MSTKQRGPTGLPSDEATSNQEGTIFMATTHSTTAPSDIPSDGKHTRYNRETMDHDAFYDGRYLGSRETAQQARDLVNEYVYDLEQSGAMHTATELDGDSEPDESIIIMCGTLGIRLQPDGTGSAHQHGGAFPTIGGDSLAALYALIQNELIAARDLTRVRTALTA